MKIYKIGIIGAGLQARRRIPAIIKSGKSQVVCISSKSPEKARDLAKKYKLKVVPNWEQVVNDKDIDIVVVTTYPDSHAKISIEAMKSGKHVLCEKPLAKNIKEAKQMVDAAKQYNKNLKCGFNHRFHPAVMKAKTMVEKGAIGKLLFGRAIYGYCGRPDFKNEWRADTRFSAGGILMEQGIHVIDLYRWFFGELKSVKSDIDQLYFPIKSFEDSAFAIFKTKNKQPLILHATTLQWKNTFQFEIFGEEGYLRIEGLGGSYGLEKLVYLKKDYYGPFKEVTEEFPGSDESWSKEWEYFLNSIESKSRPMGDGIDGLIAMQVALSAYKSAMVNKEVKMV